jgi:hypothetical protein
LENKISFAIENAEVINENPKSSFAVLSMDFFASGENLHDMYVSDETLLRTADTIKNCPLVWKYDEILDDVYTHDPGEVPCGFVPETSNVSSRKLPDGRTMLSVAAYVWKKYTGDLLSFFKRDGGKKPVSVEMSVYDSKVLPNGLIELCDFKYEGITVLGSFVTPAIPLANASVLSFADIRKQYEEAIKIEFSKVDLTIPEEIKNSCKKGLELQREVGRGGSSVALAFARHISKNEKITPEKISYILEHFSNGNKVDNIGLLLWGGDGCFEWAKDINEKLEKEKDGKISEKMEIPMKKEIDEKVPLEVENAAPPAEEKPEEKAPKEEMAAPPFPPKKEGEEDVKPGEKPEKKFEFPKNFNIEKMAEMFSDDADDDDVKMAKEEIAKGEFCNPGVVMGGMFAKMCKMAAVIAKMAEDSKVYMAENEELKKFKADVEKEKKEFAVNSTLKVLAEKVVIPDEALTEMIAKAEEYTFANISEWETYCKAKVFEFAAKETGKSETVIIGMPFTGIQKAKKDELWS